MVIINTRLSQAQLSGGWRTKQLNELGTAHWGVFLVVGPGICLQLHRGQVLCQEWGLPVVPRGWQCQARTGLWGCWEAGPGAGGVGWLPEGRGRHSYPGKTGREHVSCPCRFTAMDGTHVTGTEWLVGMRWGGCCATAQETDLRLLASLGTRVWSWQSLQAFLAPCFGGCSLAFMLL